jgi:dephospho-CoA kinase
MPSRSRAPGGSRLVVGVAGPIGAGKTTAAAYLVKAHGFRYLRYSRVLAEDFDGVKSRHGLQELGWRVMSGGLQSKLNALLVRRIRMSGDYVIDGLRHPIDYKSLKREFGRQFLLVYIAAPVALRFGRVKRRRRLRAMTEFKGVDRHPVERHIRLLRRKARALVQNTSTLGQLHRSLDRVLGEARRGGPE